VSKLQDSALVPAPSAQTWHKRPGKESRLHKLLFEGPLDRYFHKMDDSL
jgi:hypothetical protein